MIFLSLSGCATVKEKDFYPEALSLVSLCAKHSIEWTWDNTAGVMTLKRHPQTAKIMLNHDQVFFDGEWIALSGPCVMKNSAICIPPDFEEKVLERFGKAVSYAIRKLHTIIIDPGHGGKDPGAIAKSGLQEKYVVLDISQKLKKILEGQGFQVIMTRAKDEFISLQERTEIASRQSADLFMSIHANAHPSKKVFGLEVHFLRGLTNKENQEPQRLKNQQLFFETLSMSRNSPPVNGILTDLLLTQKMSESETLASRLAQETAQFIQTPNLGGKPSGFFVLRNTWIPAVLVEVGYLSNLQEGKLLSSAEYRQKIAEGIAQSLLHYSES